MPSLAPKLSVSPSAPANDPRTRESRQASEDRIRDSFPGRLFNSATLGFTLLGRTLQVPVGTAVGRLLSRTIALPQLRRLVGPRIPWTPLSRPLSDATVVLVSTGGVHLRHDRPFKLNSDSTFRVIPRGAPAGDLAISHQAYDRTDALKDINLVFPIERLRELEEEGVLGRLADDHYGFGLSGSARRLMPSIKEVARRIREAGVDLALLIPA